MKKKIIDMIPLGRNGYDWKFCSMGGVTRVSIASGDDIAHLGELDQKLWTVLSCPTTGLEFNEKTLTLMDLDKDGKIRVNEVVAAAQWLTGVLRNNDLLLTGSDSIALSEFDTDQADGTQLVEAARCILSLIGKDGVESIALADLEVFKEAFDKRCDEMRGQAVVVDERPYGDNSDAVVGVVNDLRDKVGDFFMRCKLGAYNEQYLEALNVSVETVSALSTKNLAACGAEIASYPIAAPNKEGLLPLHSGINPAWQSTFGTMLSLVDDFAGKEHIAEEEWNAVVAKADAYKAATEAKAEEGVKALGDEMARLSAHYDLMEKFLLLFRDFYKLLRNYVTFADFYSREEDTEAVFQAGRLYIDQRCCDLCVRVMDMGKHADMASLSGMFLVYCHCVSKVKGAEMDIVAVITGGDVKDIRVGKNALFYDRNGLDWDACVTKIVDNPISVKEAFWAPYRKLWNWIQEKINKSAAEKESKSMENLTSGADKFTTDMQAAQNDPNSAASKKQQAFDIAKFAGIFAAIGMAIGFIMSAITGFVDSLNGHWLIGICLILLVVSGPSMFIAWTKLRKRNLGPVLNANGWAVNANAKINVPFGATLTSMAKYPKIAFDDPFKQKETPMWQKIAYGVGIALVAAFLYFFVLNKPLPGGEMGVRTWILTKPAETMVEMFTDTTQTDTLLVVDSLAPAAE